MIKALLALVVIVGATAWWLAPARARPLEALPAGLSEPVRGAFHIHTVRSDGTGTVDQVAAAAAAAGLKFIVLTDHGDGSREADKPQYRNGVLCIDAVEISTNGGHVVALDLPRSSYCLLYTSPSPRDGLLSRMPSSA